MTYDLSISIEERPVFGKYAGLLSYAVRITYEDENNWDWEGFDLLEEIIDGNGRSSYRAPPLDEAYPRAVVAAGLTVLLRTDIADKAVVDLIEQKIIDDMADRREQAREYAAEARERRYEREDA